VIYGSSYEEKKMDFISKLHIVLSAWQDPTLVGVGDFNLVRYQKDKNTGNINFTHSTAFNEWINEWSLIEIKDPSRSFTWSNN
jgi:hypothetical protein